VEVNGTVGYGDTATLLAQADGVVTDAPESGETLRPGDELVRVANRPITLAQGEQPLYRELRRVAGGERDEAGDRLGLQKGADVEQLQRFLLDAGFDDKGRLEADGEFGLSTERAVKVWQRSRGLPATGKVDGSQLVFVAGQVRIESAPKVGQSFSPIEVTSGTPKVTITVTARQREFFAIGASVDVDSATQSATGTVTDVERRIGDDGSTRFRVEIELDPGESVGDAEAVKVTSIQITESDVLTVPVRALVALAEGGWAVHVSTPTGSQLTAVELDDVVNGVASISGVGEGTQVVVPV
jgi:peptidoglycan hydrolase-like protein with peptidoglycan-binding domain